MSTKIPLSPSTYYHIFNRGNNGETLFKAKKNYTYFLSLYAKYIPLVAETYAYCLLGNHFHFLVRILDKPAYKPFQALANLFCTYTKAINKAYDRHGSLFENPFHRIPVLGDDYLRNLVVYIHRNPQNHGLADDFRDWPFSSFWPIIDGQGQVEEVTAWFGGTGGFTAAHQACTPPLANLPKQHEL